MFLKLAFLLVVILQKYISTMASDPDSVQDFCIPKSNSNTGMETCKNQSAVTVEDFVFFGIKYPSGKFSETGLAAKSVNVNVFPGLNIQGMSFVRADFEVGGINVPHFHPRATEIAFVLQGRVYSGFVDTQDRIFAKVIEKGEVMVFPRGLLHFQMNVGDTPATILGCFDSQNPGLLRIPNAVFGPGVQEKLLEKAFGLNAKEIAKLKRKFAPH